MLIFIGSPTEGMTAKASIAAEKWDGGAFGGSKPAPLFHPVMWNNAFIVLLKINKQYNDIWNNGERT